MNGEGNVGASGQETSKTARLSLVENDDSGQAGKGK